MTFKSHGISSYFILETDDYIQNRFYSKYYQTKKIVSDILASSVNPSQIRLLLSFGNVDINEQFLFFITENLRVLCLHGMHQGSINKIFHCILTKNQIKCLRINQEFDITHEDEIDRFLIDFIEIGLFIYFTTLFLGNSKAFSVYALYIA